MQKQQKTTVQSLPIRVTYLTRLKEKLTPIFHDKAVPLCIVHYRDRATHAYHISYDLNLVI